MGCLYAEQRLAFSVNVCGVCQCRDSPNWSTHNSFCMRNKYKQYISGQFRIVYNVVHAGPFIWCSTRTLLAFKHLFVVYSPVCCYCFSTTPLHAGQTRTLLCSPSGDFLARSKCVWNMHGAATQTLYIYMHHTTTPGWLFGTNGKYYWQHRPRVTIIFTITRATRNVYLVPLSLSLPCPRGHISTTMYNNNNNTIYEIHRTNEDEIGVFAAISPKAKTPHTSTPHNINIKKKSHLIFHRPQKIVWHGSSTLGERAMDTYCDAWHSASSDKMGLASSLLGNKLLDQERYSCDNRFVVLCIEVLSHQESRRKRDLGR